MASAESRILTLIKRYITIKHLNEEPEPLNFLPDFNPLFTQDLKYDDPCTTPFKVSLDKDTAHDGYYSIKVKFSDALKPPDSPVSIDILHWDLILEQKSLILLIKRLHVLSPLASNGKKYNLIHTSANIQKILEEAWNKRKFNILEEEEWYENELKKGDKEEKKKNEEEKFVPFEIISLDDDEDNVINNEKEKAEKQMANENKADKLANSEEKQKKDEVQINMEVEIPVDSKHAEKSNGEISTNNIDVLKEPKNSKTSEELINTELPSELQSNNHKEDYGKTRCRLMKCFPEWSLYYLKTVIH
ncbi:unnamed protein product [Blepharisma stoltei]|uniref:Uncharacterized protein n=1 Tax=Blepharisma stoltei TaxID=1481888 RepID=A0AAU9IIL8_9CILI|nr:unnamed protein product [Blepharisma stoltei]